MGAMFAIGGVVGSERRSIRNNHRKNQRLDINDEALCSIIREWSGTYR